MFKKHVVSIALLIIVSTNTAKALIDGSQPNEIVEKTKNVTNERNGRSLHKECSEGINAKCMKIHVLSFIEDLSSREELPILPGLSIVKERDVNKTNPEEMAAELSRQFPGKPDEKLNRFLLYRLQDYLDGHSLRYRLLDPKTSKEALDMAKGDKSVIGRKAGGGGGGLGGKGGGGLLAAMLMMKGKDNNLSINIFSWQLIYYYGDISLLSHY